MQKKFQIIFIILLSFISTQIYAQETHLFVAATNVRIRSIPSTSGKVTDTMPLGTYREILGISKEQDELIGKKDFWYKINGIKNTSGWIFGGLTEKANASNKFKVASDLIISRLKLQGKPLKDDEQLYNFAKEVRNQTVVPEQKAKLEMLYLKSVQKIFDSLSMMGKGFETTHPSIKENAENVYYHESAGQHFVHPNAYWTLESQFANLPGIAEEIAWIAANQQLPGETEGDPTMTLMFYLESYGKYIKKYPVGPNADKAVEIAAAYLEGMPEGIKGYFKPEHETFKKEFILSLSDLENSLKRCKDTGDRSKALSIIKAIRKAL